MIDPLHGALVDTQPSLSASVTVVAIGSAILTAKPVYNTWPKSAVNRPPSPGSSTPSLRARSTSSADPWRIALIDLASPLAPRVANLRCTDHGVVDEFCEGQSQAPPTPSSG